MSLELLFLIVGIVSECGLIGILVYRRGYRSFPLFSSYVLWGFLTDLTNILLQHGERSFFMRAYLGELTVDSLLQFGVLVELSWAVLLPIRRLLPKGFLAVLTLFLLAVCGLVWWSTASLTPLTLGHKSHMLVHLQQSFSYLRILLFLLLVGTGQMLSLNWRNRELQIATGLGLYSLVSVTVAILHAHQSLGPAYHMLDELTSASYIASLLYWMTSFVRQEHERQQFTPQMEKILLTVAGAAHAEAVALETGVLPREDRRKASRNT